MADAATSGVKRAWLGRPSICSGLWILLVALTVASVVPHWTRFSWQTAPLVPHVIENLVGPDVRGSWRNRNFIIFVRDGQVFLADPDDPSSEPMLASDFDTWDEVHFGRVQPRTEWRGLWWPSVVTRGYEVFLYNNATTERVEVDRAIRVWVKNIPWIGGLPERSTKVTYFLLADLLMIALAVLTLLSTKTFAGYRRMRAHRNWQSCIVCGYDLTGIHPSQCPECGADHGPDGPLARERSEV